MANTEIVFEIHLDYTDLKTGEKCYNVRDGYVRLERIFNLVMTNQMSDLIFQDHSNQILSFATMVTSEIIQIFKTRSVSILGNDAPIWYVRLVGSDFPGAIIDRVTSSPKIVCQRCEEFEECCMCMRN